MRVFLIIKFLVACAVCLNAQGYSLRVSEQGDRTVIEVLSKKGLTKENLLTDFVFGLRWTDSAIEGLKIRENNYGLVVSGKVQTKDDVHFVSIGAMETPVNLPVDWPAGEWIELVEVQYVGGKGVISLVDEGFDLTTGPNIGIDLADEIPVIVATPVQGGEMKGAQEVKNGNGSNLKTRVPGGHELIPSDRNLVPEDGSSNLVSSGLLNGSGAVILFSNGQTGSGSAVFGVERKEVIDSVL